jgi:hypothetical protein
VREFLQKGLPRPGACRLAPFAHGAHLCTVQTKELCALMQATHKE